MQPTSILISLVRVSGYVIAPVQNEGEDQHQIDIDFLILREVIFESFLFSPAEIAHALKPVFDEVWNVGIWPGSPSYNDQGEWSPNRSCG